jgi:hypothetical protein
MEDVYYDTYKGFSSQLPGMVVASSLDGCPDDPDIVIYKNFTNVYFDFGLDRPSGTYSNDNVLYIAQISSAIIPTSISINNLTFVGGILEDFSNFIISSTSTLNTKINNLSFINSTFGTGGFQFSAGHNLTGSNITFVNCT